MTIPLTALPTDISDQLDQPTVLFQDGGHAVYWLGIPEVTAFRCNSYLIVDHHEAILVDPGNRSFFSFVKDRVEQILPPERVSGMILCHQDPDVAASFVDWVAVNPEMDVITSFRANILLPHYGCEHYKFFNIEEVYRFRSGRKLRFIPAPFLHAPGAFATYDPTAEYLFSGDTWAALDMDWKLVVDDFDAHIEKLNVFHLDYMANNRATRGFINNLDGLSIQAILPQHGSIIPFHHVQNAFEYLKNLRCGLDLLYPEGT